MDKKFIIRNELEEDYMSKAAKKSILDLYNFANKFICEGTNNESCFN